MSVSSTTIIRRLIIAVLVAVPLCSVTAVLAEPGGRLFLPVLVDSAAPWPHAQLAPTPPPVDWSEVLDRTPLFPGSRLSLFELRPRSDPEVATALYATGAASESEVLDWYGSNLQAHGWRRVDNGAIGQWHHYHGWLTVQFVQTADGARRLQLSRNVEAAARPEGTTLESGLPLPGAVRRVRFDRLDLLTEELEFEGDIAQARRSVVRVLADSGWLLEREATVGGAEVLGFTSGNEPDQVVLSLRSLDGEGAEIGIGRAQCWPVAPEAATGGFWSVYLDNVPSPPGTSIVSFERSEGSVLAIEHWQGACHDLDLLAALYEAAFDSAGWAFHWGDEPGSALREPGRLDFGVSPPEGGLPIAVTARTKGDGSLAVTLERDEEGRRRPDGTSLLFDDIPLPRESDPIQMEQNLPDGWHYREWYSVVGAVVSDLPQWFRAELPELGWKFERLEPSGQGPSLVHHAGGEELLVAFGSADDPQVVVSRRRICESEEPVSVPENGSPARNLSEMPVYPGAEFVGFDAPEEAYEVACASLAGLGEWYWRAMERGEWQLAATEGPDDPMRRWLLFVRPDEIELPPAERTAWAEVELIRQWPYQYRISLSRDPGGVQPSRAP